MFVYKASLHAGSLAHGLSLHGVLYTLHLAVLLVRHGLLLAHSAVIGRATAAWVHLGTRGNGTKIARDGVELVEPYGTYTGVVTIHVGVGVGAGFKPLGDITGFQIVIIAETFGVEVDVFHVLGTEKVLDVNTVQRAVATG